MTSSHLGGHLNKTHIDEGAFKYLLSIFDIKTMIDIGCGPGGMVELGLRNGIDSIGIDGDHTILTLNQKYESVDGIVLPIQIKHDYTTGVLCNQTLYKGFEFGVKDLTKFDLAWSVEFLEHVEEKYQANYMDTFCRAKYVLMTHALPGAPGYHHVNCRDESYWIDVFSKHRFRYLEEETHELRKRSTMVKNFIRNTGKIFIKE